MCSASTNFAVSCLASTTNWRTTTRPVSFGTNSGASRSTERNLNIAPPQIDAREQEPSEMLLVDGLAGDAEGLGDLGPRPSGAHGPLDLGVLQPICHRPKG